MGEVHGLPTHYTPPSGRGVRSQYLSGDGHVYATKRYEFELYLRAAAIDKEFDAVDEAGIAGGKEESHGSNLF